MQSRAEPSVSLGRFIAALCFAILSTGFLFVFWLFVCNGFFGFAQTTSPEGSSLLTTFAMQAFPLIMVWVGTLLPFFAIFALGPALIASAVIGAMRWRSPVLLIAVGAATGLAGFLIFQLLDVMALGAKTPVLSLAAGALPAALAGACGGLVAWTIAFGAARRAASPSETQ